MTAAEPPPAEPAGRDPAPLLSDRGLLAVLGLDGFLLGLFGLGFTPLYVGGFPVPLGALACIGGLPWLVRRAGELTDSAAPAAAPLIVWGLTVGILGLAGPGGDVLLPVTWPTLLLLFGGMIAGLTALRRGGG